VASSLEIGARRLGPGNPVFVIAEAGVNHNGDLARAIELVDVARAAGADAVKFQLYRVEEQVSGATHTAAYQRERTGSDDMKAMAASYELPWEAHREIAAHCREVGIAYLASCFDPRAVEFLLELGAESIKIASGEITNDPLLECAAATDRPILLSTGMSSLDEVARAVERIRRYGDGGVALFQCVSSYPADPATINLRAMVTMGEALGTPYGYSDHTEGHAVAAAAVGLGACMVEKHFTTDRTLVGPDHAMSLDPAELTAFVRAVRDATAALGDGIKAPCAEELEMRAVARRGLVSARPIAAGETLVDDCVTLKRPATGIEACFRRAVLGRKAAVAIPGDVPITWDMLA
jgi:N-acetylneuraminate synthase/N,N'-diacetyllegionaminate synthase